MKHLKIKPSETTVDHRFQRELDQRRVDAMARAFNPNLVGVPVVSKRADGTYVRVDGQHRVAAAISADHGDVPMLMEVHEGLSLRDEAELFLRLNGGRTAVGAVDKFRARLVAQEPVALDIFATLKRLGCKIVKGRQRGGVSAVQAVEYAYHAGNLEGTIRTLVTWLDGDAEALEGEFIRAVSAFLVACPEADPLHLAARLEEVAPTKLLNRLRRESQQVSNSKAEAARLVLTEIYNRKTRKTHQVSWSHGAERPAAEA